MGEGVVTVRGGIMKIAEDYKILISADSEYLCELVNNRLKNGWTLVGGVSVTANPGLGASIFFYAQAIAMFYDSQK